MFVSDRIVFLELQKTGCTHIRNLLREIVGGQFFMRHNQAGANLFTGDRFFLGSVRDPWDWHVSLWAYCCDGKGDLFSNLSTTGIRLKDLGWKKDPYSVLLGVLTSRPNWHAKQWKRTFRDINDPGAFREWLHMLHDPAYWGDIGEGYWRCPLNRFAGLLTYRYLRLFTSRKNHMGGLRAISSPEQLAEHDRQHCFVRYFIRNENLEADLLEALKLADVPVPQRFVTELTARPKTNTSSKKRGARYYYDAETEKLVGDRDRFIIEKFGYLAPSARDLAEGNPQRRAAGTTT
ncbi:hypothetical protein [Frateuria sp. YIM B11624]|uniref:hypothetical protein n=1 Tax=Frateuria sp. YIM B11624 TaxID=3143185 RepID=UPI003C7489D5